MAYLQRHRIAPAPGYATSLAFLALYVVSAFGPWMPDKTASFFWSSLWLALAFGAYLGVGSAAWMRG